MSGFVAAIMSGTRNGSGALITSAYPARFRIRVSRSTFAGSSSTTRIRHPAGSGIRVRWCPGIPLRSPLWTGFVILRRNETEGISGARTVRP
jgi:hypothetical protein